MSALSVAVAVAPDAEPRLPLETATTGGNTNALPAGSKVLEAITIGATDSADGPKTTAVAPAGAVIAAPGAGSVLVNATAAAGCAVMTTKPLTTAALIAECASSAVARVAWFVTDPKLTPETALPATLRLSDWAAAACESVMVRASWSVPCTTVAVPTAAPPEATKAPAPVMETAAAAEPFAAVVSVSLLVVESYDALLKMLVSVASAVASPDPVVALAIAAD